MSTDDQFGVVQTSAAAPDYEEAILAKAGYRPELRRSLRFFSMFAIAFSIISITTGIFLNYGFGLQYWGPASIWTWPIVGVGQPDDRAGRRRAWHPDPAGRLCVPVELPAGELQLRLVRRLRRAAVHDGGRRGDHAAPWRRRCCSASSTSHNPNPRLVFAVAIILMLLPVVLQHHQHSGGRPSEQPRGVHRDHRHRRLRRAAVRALGAEDQADAVRGRASSPTPRRCITIRRSTLSRWPA